MLLNKRMPGWHKKVDLDSFNFRAPESCVLGQTLGGFNYALEFLGIGKGKECIDYGFDAGYRSDYDEYPALNLEWYNRISALQANHNPQCPAINPDSVLYPTCYCREPGRHEHRNEG